MIDYIYNAITNLSDDLIEEAITTNLRHKLHWQPYVAAAACLAVIISAGSQISWNMGTDSSSSSSSSSSTTTTTTTTTESAPAPETDVTESVVEDATTGVIYTSNQVETLTLTLVSWDANSFRATVVTGDESGLFPEGADLTVIFESADPWPEGTIVTVSFTDYAQYVADNGFDNCVYATVVDIN